MIKRTFVIGDNWLYYKLYAGPKAIDLIISEILPEIIEKLKTNILIDKWFFVKYNIPDYHLRLRFHTNNIESIANIIHMFRFPLEEMLNSKLCHKIELDTYNRELERYGHNTIEIIESLFFHDSEFSMNYIKISSENEDGEPFRWLLALIAIDQCLTCFDLNTQEKLDLIQGMRNSFWKEFGLGRMTKKQIDSLFREKRKAINKVLIAKEYDQFGLGDMIGQLELRSIKVNEVAKEIRQLMNGNELQVNFQSLLASIIHMSMNRIFISKNRMNEVVCYDFLQRHYKSEIMRSKKLKYE